MLYLNEYLVSIAWNVMQFQTEYLIVKTPGFEAATLHFIIQACSQEEKGRENRMFSSISCRWLVTRSSRELCLCHHIPCYQWSHHRSLYFRIEGFELAASVSCHTRNTLLLSAYSNFCLSSKGTVVTAFEHSCTGQVYQQPCTGSSLFSTIL